MKELALVLSCGVGAYLQIGAPFKASATWDVVEKRFSKRLAL